MSAFAYRAMDPRGRIVRGRVDAANLVDLELRLRRLDLDLVHGSPIQPRFWQTQKGASRRELIKFCFHLEQFLRAGVPIIESLTDLRDAIRRPHFRQVVAATVESIEGGLTLSQALAQHPTVFDGVFCSLIRAGEHTGRLPEVLHALSESLKRDDELAAYARRIVIYPAIVGLVILAALGVALIYVVPELARLFRTVGQALPWQTRALIAVSDALLDYGWALLAVIATTVIGARQAVLTRPEIRLRFDAAMLRLPILGAVRRKIILARFTGLFAMMYASGITIIDALQVAEDVVGNSALKNGLQQVGRGIEQGRKVSEAFRAVELFPPLVTRMLRVGESTGALDTALANVSYFYDRDVREAIERLQAGIEPTLTLILGGLLMAVMSAVMMPVYDIVTRMKF
ncbi:MULTISPECIES: type II secretion system F family protein [Zoogloea]|jgi:type IV pilus assembly protein PilC|uniref:type II secretion system F family protein n=1 Tax=Zoogloea TaxID=349 RepID=UPI00258D8832|nr:MULTISPECIES: type II secretion system F family protein [Zoogloea]MBT9497258.1 type II secretion system F family protein [Zoogloea sp.]MDD2666978.1 type II secretion system F family protein [Zoogloea sp.]MDY0037394.1 type II secretion system F family protein [Zoogloea oleivorans]